MQNRPLAALRQCGHLEAHLGVLAPRHGGEMWPPLRGLLWHSRNLSCTFEAKNPRYLIEMAQEEPPSPSLHSLFALEATSADKIRSHEFHTRLSHDILKICNL